MVKSTRPIRSCSAILIIAVVLVIYFTGEVKQGNKPDKVQKRFQRSVSKEGGNITKRAENKFFSTKVWLASTISVFIISAVGLLGVAVVPLIQKVFYNKIIQYLVALAVGSLTGDAFLHLIPHAILGEHKEAEGEGAEEGNEELVSVLKGLVALGGVYFFFVAEKCLSMISDYRAEKRAEEEEHQRQLKDPRRSELRRLSAMQLSVGSGAGGPNVGAGANRRGSHMGSQRDSAMFRRLSKVVTAEDEEDNIITTGLSSRAMKSVNNLIRFAELDMDDAELGGTCSNAGGFLTVPGTTVVYQSGGGTDETGTTPSAGEEGDGEIRLMVPSPGRKDSEGTDTKVNQSPGYHVTIVSNDEKKDHSGDHSSTKGSPSKSMSVEVRDTKKEGSHGHGHSHEVPGSIAAVAWMVIMGDGLHNFSDGLAIGAAFADKISGGISTAVAVFCHELPHELGDFAVLLKTGMSVKQALFYNIVSSVLCFLGMLIGISLHNVESASYWIFAATAGTFVYIALVDMLPELNSAEVRPGESRIVHFLIQNLGLMTGVGIMLLIALFEENIKAILD